MRTWRQQEMAMAFIWLLLQKHVPMPLSCIRIFVDFLVHDNVELRKVNFLIMSIIDYKIFYYLYRYLKKVLQHFVVYKNHLEFMLKKLLMKFFNVQLMLMNVVQVIVMIICGLQSIIINHLKHNLNGNKCAF